MRQDGLFSDSRTIQTNPNDVVYTPDAIAQSVVSYFKPTGFCLDPCRGTGAFYRWLPTGSDWCEIAEGRDFFAFDRKVDWIISNPPFSQWDDWLKHSFLIAANVVYLIPLVKTFKNAQMLKVIQAYGGIPTIAVIGSGRSCGFPFGFLVAAVHFQKDYKGTTKIGFLADLMAEAG